MGNTEKRVGLSRSQSEIALSEEVYPGSALNTISVTMFFEDYSAEKAAAACDRVFESSDVFKAALVKEGTGYCFYPDSRQILPCLISVKRTREQAEDHISGLNAQPMVFPRNLYHAEAFDLGEGGSALIVRFHHILTDGYGMSLFAQRVADALEGRAFSRSVFFGNDGKLSADSSPGDTEFWRTYFSDNTAEPAVFSEKAEGFGKTSVPVSLGNDLQNAAKHISEKVRRYPAVCVRGGLCRLSAGSSGKVRRCFPYGAAQQIAFRNGDDRLLYAGRSRENTYFLRG